MNMSEKYVVVQFVAEKTDDGKPVVELVPRGWLTVVVVTGNSKCAFPPPPYTNLKDMVQRMDQPGLLWNEYPVILLGWADTYRKGLIKLERAIQKLNTKTDIDEALEETEDDPLNASALLTYPCESGRSKKHRNFPSGSDISEISSSSKPNTVAGKSDKKKGGVVSP